MRNSDLYLLALLSAGILSCSRNGTSGDEEVRRVAQTDAAFSKMSEEQGMAMAFIEFADDDVIKLNPRSYPALGKAELIKSFDGFESNGKLTWEPLKVEVDGKLAYSFGDWTMKTTVQGRDTVLYGNYLSVWKKQPDGKWKYVVDGGNPTPGPTPRDYFESLK